MAERTVLQRDDISRALHRIAHEILETNHGTSNLVLLGIPTRGVVLAQRLAECIYRIEPGEYHSADRLWGSLDVTMYRDDLTRTRIRTPQPTSLPTTIDGKVVVLVDDVLFSGRTIRAALDALNDLGRPRTVRLAALVDRGHRELPIRADYVGKNLPSALTERIYVRLDETDGTESVSLDAAPRDGDR